MFVNVMERHAEDAYDRLRGAIAEFADSPQHRDDVIVYALNRLPPKYVVTNQGKVVTDVALDGDQHRAAIEVQVMEAMRFVARRPRAGV
jgi:competence protein ComFB